MAEPITSTALYQQVASHLRERIDRRELKPGERIDEKRLCNELGISRTPLREALKVLDADGLVNLLPRRGCFVAELSAEQLDELFPVMAVLEGLIAREATLHYTSDELARLESMHAMLEATAAKRDTHRYFEVNFRFHQAVQDLSRNRYLRQIARDLGKLLSLARHHQLRDPSPLDQSLEEHRCMMAAFRARRADLAERSAREHVERQGAAIVSWLRSNEAPTE